MAIWEETLLPRFDSLRSLLMSPFRCRYLNGRTLHFRLRQDTGPQARLPEWVVPAITRSDVQALHKD